MAKCLQVLKVCQTANERQDYAFNLTKEFSRLWQPDFPQIAASVVRPYTDPTGLEYSSSGGVTGPDEPIWPLAIGDEVEDGTVTWTGQAKTNSGLRHRISTVTWTAPSGITASDQVETDDPALQEARIYVSGGTVGETYTIIGEVETISGVIYEVRLEVEIK